MVSDYDQVRAWLGVEQFDFYGISYGVRVGLEYMRIYPQRMNTLTAQGCVPPGFDYVNEMEAGKPVHAKRIYREMTVFEPQK